VGGLDLGGWHGLEVADAAARLRSLTATGQGELARRELLSRLEYLERVGLGYLALDRPARTLSGGEAQRVSLTAALGSLVAVVSAHADARAAQRLVRRAFEGAPLASLTVAVERDSEHRVVLCGEADV